MNQRNLYGEGSSQDRNFNVSDFVIHLWFAASISKSGLCLVTDYVSTFTAFIWTYWLWSVFPAALPALIRWPIHLFCSLTGEFSFRVVNQRPEVTAWFWQLTKPSIQWMKYLKRSVIILSCLTAKKSAQILRVHGEIKSPEQEHVFFLPQVWRLSGAGWAASWEPFVVQNMHPSFLIHRN